MSPGQDHRRSNHPFVTPPGAAKPLPITGEDVGGGSDVARPELILFGKDSAGTTGQLLLNLLRALVTEPRGSANLPFLQSVVDALAVQLQGDNNTALSQDALNRLEVTSFQGPPSPGFEHTTLIRAALQLAETVHFTGTVGQRQRIDLIHLANSSAVVQNVDVWLTPNATAGTVATNIIADLLLPQGAIVELNGPFMLDGNSEIRASSSPNADVVQFEVTAQREI